MLSLGRNSPKAGRMKDALLDQPGGAPLRRMTVQTMTIRVALIVTSMHALAVWCWAAAPAVGYVFPAGGQRGQTVEVTVAGTLDHWPAPVWCDRPGVVVSAAADKGKLRRTSQLYAATGPESRASSAPGMSVLLVTGQPRIAPNQRLQLPTALR